MSSWSSFPSRPRSRSMAALAVSTGPNGILAAATTSTSRPCRSRSERVVSIPQSVDWTSSRTPPDARSSGTSLQIRSMYARPSRPASQHLAKPLVGRCSSAVGTYGGLVTTTSNWLPCSGRTRSPCTTRTRTPFSAAFNRVFSRERRSTSTAVIRAVPASPADTDRRPVPAPTSKTRVRCSIGSHTSVRAKRKLSACGG